MVTLKEEEKLVPLAGVKLGVAAGDCSLYAAEATALWVKPLAVAMASIVVEALMVMGPE
jgi:hypothetical protein